MLDNKDSNTSSAMRTPNRLARSERESAEELAAIQWLANLQNEKDAEEFIAQKPDFVASLFEGYNDRPLILSLQRGRPISEVEQIRLPTPEQMERSKAAWVLAVSEDVRLIWRNDPRHAERLLTDYLFYGRRMTPDPEETKKLEEQRRAWDDWDKSELPWVETEEECRARERNEKECRPSPDEIILHEAAKDVRELPVRPDWRHGGFVYAQPAPSPLQLALYWMLVHSNRVRICANPDCENPYFIAPSKKPNQRTCSSECGHAADRERKLRHWNAKGRFERKQRMEAAKRAKKSKGGR